MKTSDELVEYYVDEFEHNLVLPEYLYTSIYIEHMNEIKSKGLTPDISNLSWNESLLGFIFLTEDSEYAGHLADSSNKINFDSKECIFILKIKTDKLNKNNIFVYTISENPKENIYLYHGSFSYSLVNIAYSYY